MDINLIKNSFNDTQRPDGADQETYRVRPISLDSYNVMGKQSSVGLTQFDRRKPSQDPAQDNSYPNISNSLQIRSSGIKGFHIDIGIKNNAKNIESETLQIETAFNSHNRFTRVNQTPQRGGFLDHTASKTTEENELPRWMMLPEQIEKSLDLSEAKPAVRRARATNIVMSQNSTRYESSKMQVYRANDSVAIMERR